MLLYDFLMSSAFFFGSIVGIFVVNFSEKYSDRKQFYFVVYILIMVITFPKVINYGGDVMLEENLQETLIKVVNKDIGGGFRDSKYYIFSEN